MAAVVLDPTQKWEYFIDQWANRPDWLTTWKEKIEAFWEQDYKVDESESFNSSTPSDELSQNSYVAHLQSKQAGRGPKDEYRRYISTPVVDNIHDPRAWWLESTQQRQFPTLSRMALDLLTIPAMSADAERLFSSSKLQSIDSRNRLSLEVLEQLECLKSWMNLANWYEDEVPEEEL